MIKLLIGGSPCTYWSIAQKNNRETEPSGMGWELFKNYLIAKEKFKPDFFLYENNKSADEAIKQQIRKELNVWDGTFLMEDSGARYIEINSALVSAQNRQRFYVHNCGNVEQPEDRGILLRDILESGQGWTEKSHAMTASYDGAVAWNTLERHQRTMVAEPVIFQTPRGNNAGGCKYEKSPTMTANASWQDNNRVVEPMCKTIENALPKLCDTYGYLPGMFNAYNCAEITDKSPTLSTGSMDTSSCATSIFERTEKPAYEVRNGQITIKGKQYPIKLADGFYIIRKLTVKECCRLQGMPDWWFLDNEGTKILSDSQAYKGLGNGWQLDTVKYILEHGLKNVPENEELIVLSLYDGIATGRRILEELGFTQVKYYAYEIDKYCIKLTSYRYPDIIHCGDAFAVRNEDWKL